MNAPTAMPTAGVSLQGMLLAVAVVLGAAIAAVAAIPEDAQAPDALFAAAALMALGLVAPVLLRLRGDVTSVVRIESALMIGLVYWLLLDLLQAAYPLEGVTRDHVVGAFTSIGIFAAALWIGVSGQGWRLPRRVAEVATWSITDRVLFYSVLVSFALGMLNFAYTSGFNPQVMIEGLLVDRWSAPWARGQFGDSGAFLEHTQYFGYVIPALCVLLAKRLGWLNPAVLVSLGLALIMLAFISQGGGRRLAGVMIGGALATWLITHKRLTPKLLLGTVAAVIVLLIGLQEMLRFRQFGFQAWLAGEEREFRYSHLHVDDNFLRLSQIVMVFPDFHDYVGTSPVVHALALPIPRALWPEKPSSPGFDLPSLVGYETGASLSSSILGELYASYGLAAVFLGGLLYGRIASAGNRILALPDGTSKPLVYGFWLMVMFAGLRSMQAFVQMSYVILAWILVSKLIVWFQARSATARRAEGKP